MFVADDPAPSLLTKTDGEAQPVRRDRWPAPPESRSAAGRTRSQRPCPRWDGPPSWRSPSGAGPDGRYVSAGIPAENLGAIGPGPNSVLIGHSVRFCDFCGHEPPARQLEDAGVGSECGHDPPDEQRGLPVRLVLEVLDVGHHALGEDEPLD